MPPILHTERLRLRPPRKNDLENIYQLGANPRVMRYITSGRTQTRADARKDLQRRMRTANDPLGYWIIEHREDDAFIGWIALKPLPGFTDIEIGYRLQEACWSQGYATEAARAVLHYGFCELQIAKIVAVAREENRASTRVMEKLGMRYVKKVFAYDTECVYYSILRSTYQMG